VARRLQLLREVAPGMGRVAVLWNATNSTKAGELREARGAAESLGLQLLSAEVRRADDFDGAFQAAASSRADALMVLSETLVNAQMARIVAFTLQQGLPSIYEVREATEAGGLMNYGLNLADLFRRAAIYADKILKGARPGELPVEQPTRFDFVINLRTARELGLTIPESVLLQATHVIQ
jgi:putative ABC transport system substrate-binding protein